MGEEAMEANVKWTKAYVNTLPDSAFLYVASGGVKDEQGRSHPLTLRKLPYRDKSGRVDTPHLRNALARLAVADIDASLKPAIRRKACRILSEHGGECRDIAQAANPRDPRIAPPSRVTRGPGAAPEMWSSMEAQRLAQQARLRRERAVERERRRGTTYGAAREYGEELEAEQEELEGGPETFTRLTENVDGDLPEEAMLIVVPEEIAMGIARFFEPGSPTEQLMRRIARFEPIPVPELAEAKDALKTLEMRLRAEGAMVAASEVGALVAEIEEFLAGPPVEYVYEEEECYEDEPDWPARTAGEDEWFEPEDWDIPREELIGEEELGQARAQLLRHVSGFEPSDYWLASTPFGFEAWPRRRSVDGPYFLPRGTDAWVFQEEPMEGEAM